MTSTDPRTPLEAFKDALVDAMAAEFAHVVRAPREQWEVAAQGVLRKMNIRGVPYMLTGSAPADAVLFDRQERAELPQIQKVTDGEDGPIIQPAEQGDGADRAPGDPAEL